MVPITRSNPPVNPKHNKRSIFELTLRQRALFLSIIIFIITAILTICATLGRVHSRDVVALVRHDIQDEIQENEYSVVLNEIKLHHSEKMATRMACLLEACAWVSFLNLACAAVLIYGVVARRFACVVPWLVVSMTTYAVVVVFELLAYFEAVHAFRGYVSFRVLVATLSCVLVFAFVWHEMFLYLLSLRNKLKSSDEPLVYQTVEGYTHTLKPPAYKSQD